MDVQSQGDDLAKTFGELFQLTLALDEASKWQVFRIRHEVYCQDLGWEAIREDGLESDEFDRHSFHCLLRRRGTGEPVGCARLIVARPEDRAYPFPFEKSCSDVLDRSVADPARMPRDSIGEVSRLAVMRTFRQRKGEFRSAVSVAQQDFEPLGSRTRFPFVPVSLYLGAAAIARKVNIENVFVLTEPRLAAHFSRIGFDIRRVGGSIEHRGTRVPSLLSSSKIVTQMRPSIRPLYSLIEKAIEHGFRVNG